MVADDDGAVLQVTHGRPEFLRQVDRVLAEAWSRDDLQAALLVVVRGIVDVVGFEVATVNALTGSDEFRVVVTAGRDDAVVGLRDRSFPASMVLEMFELAERWGSLRFVPHHRLPDAVRSSIWIADDALTSTDPGSWHPADTLTAPLHDPEGSLVGMLSVDLPTSGRLPDAVQRQQLEAFVTHAGRALAHAMEQESRAEEVRLASAARDVVRRASAGLDIDQVFTEMLAAVTQGLWARGAWARNFAIRPAPVGELHASVGAPGSDRTLSTQVLESLGALATMGWERQEVFVLSARHPAPDDVLGPADYAELRQAFVEHDVDCVLLVPLGAGDECLGHLSLSRAVGDHEWTAAEQATALDIGHDVGRAILNARTFAQERRAVEQLQRVDDYKRELISTFSHELRTPLTSISGHLELLELEAANHPLTTTSLTAMRRGVGRLGRLVDDLLTLSRFLDPDLVIPTDEVEIADIVRASIAAVSSPNRVGGRLRVVEPAGTVCVAGDRAELQRAFDGLLANAAAGPATRDVSVEVRTVGDEVLVVVHDTGIGPTDADRSRLLEELFPASGSDGQPQQVSRLGLGIAERIIALHRGRVEVQVDARAGTTFTIVLPGC